MSINVRLKEARVRAGHKTAAAAAKHLRIPYGTYSGHESGSRGIKRSEIRKYAEAFNVSEAWLIFGDIRKPAQRSVVVVTPSGLVGEREDGQISWFPATLAGAKTQQAPHPWEQGPELLSYAIEIESFKYSVPGIPMSGEYLPSIFVNGTGISALVEVGSVIYFSKDMYEFEDRFYNMLCLCFTEGTECYLAKPTRPDADGKVHLIGPSKPKILKTRPRYVMPVWAVMTPHARTEVLHLLVDGLQRYAKQ